MKNVSRPATINPIGPIEIPMFDPLISGPQLAKYLGCSESLVEKMRLSHSGPPVVRVGKLCRYRVSDILRYLEQNKDSTSAVG
jgi:predicted DNA-binding transcriptional regulator AlpA